MGRIWRFIDEYRWLSNFWPAEVTLDGVVYPSVEHAYQAAKTLDPAFRAKIAGAKTPGDAKRLGKQLNSNGLKRPDWDKINIGIVRDLLIQKFRYPDLRKKLLDTGNTELVEGNYWHDNFWGKCYCYRCYYKLGKNALGNLLMEVREFYRTLSTNIG